MKRPANNDGKTPLDDTSGLLVDASSREELNAVEFQNVSQATLKYLGRRPTDRQAPFTYEWFLKVHRDMFGKVWKWAGTASPSARVDPPLRKRKWPLGSSHHEYSPQKTGNALDRMA